MTGKERIDGMMTMTTSSDTSFNSKAFVNCVAAFDMVSLKEINDVGLRT